MKFCCSHCKKQLLCCNKVTYGTVNLEYFLCLLDHIGVLKKEKKDSDLR